MLALNSPRDQRSASDAHQVGGQVQKIEIPRLCLKIEQTYTIWKEFRDHKFTCLFRVDQSCAATSSPTSVVPYLAPVPSADLAPARQADRPATITRSSMASSGSYTPAPLARSPRRYGPWQTVFSRFNAWRRDGTWARIVTSLLDELDDKGLLDHDLWCVDGSVVRASRAAAGAGKGGRGPRRLGGCTRRRSRSPLTMPWAVRAAGSRPRSTWSATNVASSWRSTSRPARRTRVRHSSPPWPIDSSTPPRLAGPHGG